MRDAYDPPDNPVRAKLQKKDGCDNENTAPDDPDLCSLVTRAPRLPCREPDVRDAVECLDMMSA
jgi:hypothetical protein